MNSARSYFANLGADVARCVLAAQDRDSERYEDSLQRAYKTLSYLREAKRPEAYEEGQLLLRGLEFARQTSHLPEFNRHLNSLIAEYAPVLS